MLLTYTGVQSIAIENMHKESCAAFSEGDVSRENIGKLKKSSESDQIRMQVATFSSY